MISTVFEELQDFQSLFLILLLKTTKEFYPCIAGGYTTIQVVAPIVDTKL